MLNLNFINQLVYFIYPKRCMFCDELIPINEENYICKHCYMDLNFIYGDKEPNISVLAYDEKSRFAILRLKYYNKKNYAKGFANLMYNKFSKLNTSNYDLIINVPMYAKKKRKRGYDQAEVLALEFSKLCSIPLEKDNLIRYKDTPPQSKVSFDERKTNVENAFSVKYPQNIKNKNIILVDDIYTTGNTINQCAKELYKIGANNICYFTLAKVIKKD